MQTQESKVDTGKALDAGLVVMESSETESEVQDTSSRSGNDTDTDDADIRPIYDEEPMAEVQLTAGCNIFATGQKHIEQPEFNNEGGVDQYTRKCQVKGPMLDSSLDYKTTEFSNQSLESENNCLKKTVAQFQKDFSRMEAHCIALELKYRNQSSKSGQHGQFLKVKSKETEHDIDVTETTNIELEHIQTKDHNDSLIVQLNNKYTENADLKSQIQEKVFAIAALKNELRKLKGNSVFSTWMAFGGNTRDLGSFEEETDEITYLHQILEEVLLTGRGDGIASIKRHCRDPSSNDVRDLATALGRGRLNEDLESST
ncbi:hypothetical protein Tco_0133427 [Tanacetum coccineum]